jgi:pimeloyl-ACP methyl ester carboxylesterase
MALECRFGGSYDPSYQPEGIKYYVDAFMLLTKHANFTKFHIVGHHTGASIGAEIALLYPDAVLSLTVSGPAILTKEEQSQWRDHDLICFNYPVADGTHVQKTWDFVWSFADWDPVEVHPYVLDVSRAYQGRIQAYTAVFDHDLIKVMGLLKGPILNLTADDDMLSPYMGRVKEIVNF